MKAEEQPGRHLEQEEALARSVLYAALASGLHWPEPHSLGRLLTLEGRHTLRLAAAALDPTGPLAAAVARLEELAPSDLAGIRNRYDGLFGHTARGPVCAFETEYGADDLFRQPQELAHIGGYYQAFGLRVRREGERVDHIACECEFMAFLAGREACLLEPLSEADEGVRERDEQLETTRAAARHFLRDHLGRFGMAFGASLAREDPEGLFGTIAGLLVALLRCDAERLDVALGPATLNLRPPATDAVPMACGSCPELATVGQRSEP